LAESLQKVKTLTFYEGKKVLVTGGSGLIGSHLIEALLKEGAEVRTVIHSRPLQLKAEGIEVLKGDLTHMEDCIRAVENVEYVLHLAGVVGGVGMNSAHPALMYTPNILMNTHMLEAARQANVDRYLFTSSACIYPANISYFEEARGWDAPPERTNASYGWVKRMGEFQAQAYVEEYGMKIAIVRPTNAYGPHDNFDLETSHVIPALIRKAVERQDPFVIWASGEASRDFIYARDIARGMAMALERYPVPDPINLATGRSIKIKDLAYLILKISGYENARVIFDRTKPLGQLERTVSIAKAKEKIGFVAKIGLEEGLNETIEWYRSISSRYKDRSEYHY